MKRRDGETGGSDRSTEFYYNVIMNKISDRGDDDDDDDDDEEEEEEEGDEDEDDDVDKR